MKIICSQVSKQFGSRQDSLLVLDNISFSMDESEFLCILGPSGCGKTTLLRIIAGILTPTSGTVSYEGIKSENGLPTALVFQEHGIFPWMNVIDNICFGLEVRHMAKKDRYEVAMPVIERMGLAGFIRSYPHQLSLGMKQRVGLARAMISGADVLLMDEPFASLDVYMRMILQEKLMEIYREYNKSIMYVTHDIDEAMSLGDRILLLTGRPGQIREEIKISFGRPRDLQGQNINEYAAIKKQIWDHIKDETRGSLDIV